MLQELKVYSRIMLQDLKVWDNVTESEGVG